MRPPIASIRSAVAVLAVLAALASHGSTEPRSALTAAEKAAALLAAYPGALARIKDNVVVFRDGTRLPFDDGRGDKDFATLLVEPDIEDMLAIPYSRDLPPRLPAENEDPGRIRNAAFFAAMYGDCRKGEVTKNLVDVVWLPKHSGVRLRVTRINGVAERLSAVSRQLDDLLDGFAAFLTPPAGAYYCRAIAGTGRTSAHGYGIAIDIATTHAHYWRWVKPEATGAADYRNAIPQEVVAIFEKHGFIWGGRWYHYDTMHFEYRPEMLGGGR